MFTIDQIKTAHKKVKSGADFPDYIREIKALGVISYKTWVKDSHTDYFGENNYQTSSNPMYPELSIASTSDKEKFIQYLKIHQKGETDYPGFCHHCAETGIENWFVSLTKMTCTYYDKAGNDVLLEQIPQ